VGSGCTHGPNFPTLTLGFNTTIRLPKGIQIVARGEYQGGHFVRDDVSSNALTRSVRWPYCFEAYPQIEAGNEGNLSTWLQSTCLRGNVRAHWFVYPADFFKLRELSATVPVAAIIPAVSAATLTFSARNIFRWRNKDFPVFDAEMMGDEGIDATVRTIGHHVPLPATFTRNLGAASVGWVSLWVCLDTGQSSIKRSDIPQNAVSTAFRDIAQDAVAGISSGRKPCPHKQLDVMIGPTRDRGGFGGRA
jgi:hypothetical protein